MTVQVRAYLTHTFANRLDTEYLQESLLALGYHPGPTDGRFGVSTMRAVVAFQNDSRVESNGHADPPTWAALDKALHSSAKKAAPAEKAETQPKAEAKAAKKPAAKKPAAKKATAKKG